MAYYYWIYYKDPIIIISNNDKVYQINGYFLIYYESLYD
jgi:hypothetical protein